MTIVSLGTRGTKSRDFRSLFKIIDDRNWTYLCGKMHSFDNEPSATENTTKFWHCRGNRHRGNDLPAYIWHNNNGLPGKAWYKKGKPHRDNDKPAMKYTNGELRWYKHGKCHRDNGLPAVICPNGDVEYWEHGVRIIK